MKRGSDALIGISKEEEFTGDIISWDITTI